MFPLRWWVHNGVRVGHLQASRIASHVIDVVHSEWTSPHWTGRGGEQCIGARSALHCSKHCWRDGRLDYRRHCSLLLDSANPAVGQQ